MTTGKSFLICALAAGLCVAGSAQAFCFMKGNNNARGLNHYNYPLPPIAFTQSQYYGYPYSSMMTGKRYEYIRPVVMPEPPEPPDNSPIEGIEIWRQ